MALVLKTSCGKTHVGSNPTLSVVIAQLQHACITIWALTFEANKLAVTFISEGLQ